MADPTYTQENFEKLATDDRQKQSFGIDENSKVARRVMDEETHRLLGNITGSSDTTATIYNVSAVTSGTEYSQALPANTKGFIIRSRGKSKIQLAYTSGASGTTFITIPGAASFEDENFYTSQTLYFQCDNNNETVEILAFS